MAAGSFKTLAAALQAAGLVDTLNGTSVKTMVEGGTVMVDNAKVVKTDDTVMLPKSGRGSGARRGKLRNL